jgi:hypothetical protein
VPPGAGVGAMKLMDLECPSLSLAADWADGRDQNGVFLVASIDGLRLFRDGEWAVASRSLVLWSSESHRHRLANVFEFTVPQPLPDFLAGTALAGDTGWMTGEFRRRSLVVEKVK